MRHVLDNIASFWSTEEVPRWLGLLLVTVYIGALGAIGWTTHHQMEDTAWSQLTGAREESVRILADILAAGPEATGQLQSVIERFARGGRSRELRIYDRDGRVLASQSANEIGDPLMKRAAAPQVLVPALDSVALPQAEGEKRRILIRAPVTASGKPPARFVEAVFELDPPATTIQTSYTSPLAIGLACTAAFLVVYRLMRRHFRSHARIAESLMANSDQLEEQLRDLRVNDARDRVAECWNRLIDLTLSLEEEVARSTASSELLAALSKTNAGDLAEAIISVPLGVILVSEDHTVLYANKVAARLTGWPDGADAGVGLDDNRTTPEGAKIVATLHCCMHEHGSLRAVDRQVEATDGSYYHVRVVPVRTQQQSHRYVILILDVSQQVRADAAREEFVSQVTHELRTPLTNIRAYAETLSSGMFDDPNVITECYNVITKETRRLSRLIEDILSISQLEVGSMQLVFDNVDLRALLTESVRDVRGIAENKDIDLQISLPPKLDPIQADRDKLAVVVNNLLGNALKYTAKGGQVILSCRVKDEQVRISIKDNGIGIDPADQGRIFEKFQRADDPSVQEETGTGIGLTTAREIVKQHGGDIALLSKKGEGSTFTVLLPATQRAPAGMAMSR
jgi:PAS domain S-box-containing protein